MKYMLIILLAVLGVVGIVFASYDAPPRPKATPDLATFIIQVPAEVYKKHGASERTDIMYNLARFKELYIESATQIQVLTGRVNELEAKVSKLEKPPVSIAPVDPNNVG